MAEIAASARWQNMHIRALSHSRTIAATKTVEMMHGSMSERADVERAMVGVTHVVHVVHVAICKEIPDLVMVVTVKGLFWLLESFRTSHSAQQFILLGGDASIGHFFIARMRR